MVRELAWYEGPGTPDSTWWWAVEHLGHPAFYLRALLPGDFAPGRGPAPRHTLIASGQAAEGRSVVCDTCGVEPRPEDLEPIERTTGHLGHLAAYRAGRVSWPRATDPASCWLCSSPAQRAYLIVETSVGKVRACEGCARHMSREKK